MPQYRPPPVDHEAARRADEERREAARSREEKARDEAARKKEEARQEAAREAEEQRREAARRKEDENRQAEKNARNRALEQQKASEEKQKQALQNSLQQKLKDGDFKRLEAVRKDSLKSELQKKIEDASASKFKPIPGVTGFTQEITPNSPVGKLNTQEAEAQKRRKADEAERAAAQSNAAYEARKAELREHEKRKSEPQKPTAKAEVPPSHRYLDYCIPGWHGQGSCACSQGNAQPGILQRWCTDTWGPWNRCDESWFCGPL